MFFCSISVASAADGPGLGRALTPAEARAADTVVLPDGRGLPAGRGSARDGARLYATRCVACHGAGGRGGVGGELAGGDPDLTRDFPDQNVGTYWPHATTLFDFIRRSMPLDAPWSLSDAETYALAAYLLALNGILPEDAELDAASLATIRMPNRDGFDGIEAPAAVHPPVLSGGP